MLSKTIRGTVSALKPAINLALRNFAYAWSPELENDHVIPTKDQIINPALINKHLEETKKYAGDKERIRDILQIAEERALLKKVDPTQNMGSEYVQGLSLEEAATLLNMDENNESLMQDLFDTALTIKREIYGNRIVLFAPLYLANYCMNSCTYCAYRGENKNIERNAMTQAELIEEVKALQELGHRRALVLTGEHPKYPFDSFLDALKTISEVKTEPYGSIRRINVEIPPLSVSDFRRLKDTNVVGTYTLFQESYHEGIYKQMHPYGPKSDFEYRLQTMDRAQIAGIDDVGIGALLGLHDYKYEVMAMMMHGSHLESTYGAGPHTISIPRMRPADGAPDSEQPPAPVDDNAFRKLVAVIRCAVPYTGMILSTRESEDMRRQLLHLGVSQFSAGSRTEVGGYVKGDLEGELAGDYNDNVKAGQFSLLDHRCLDDVVKDLLKDGFVPSWCTACYRLGRTGEEFMKIAKCGEIKNFCHPNALLTLQEYLDDYASDETKSLGLDVIAQESQVFDKEKVKEIFKTKMQGIKEGERDLCL
eukprot:TRINITY_DN12144_c2_g3_i1.p1 TRINITY_DN12144_c2_g3~~TRINITY_DN12144_c2_g3_i1.p1  ORF type:complete len:535 (-),score=189.98 TRINITY_DN12144_c2_g3_i1:511-2115(-)